MAESGSVIGNPILGIDFGTTNTAAAYFDRSGKLCVVKTGEKSNILPSVVWFRSANKTLIGALARTQIIDDPRHTVFEAKRFLARRYQSEFVGKYRHRFAYEIVEGTDGYCAVQIYEHLISLTEVASCVIRQILAFANHAAGEPFTECVLTVPTHATFRQREAMRHAARRAGLSVRAIVNEPTAAALYYANLLSPQQTVLVFDLGGGTFDATLISVTNRIVRVLATGGDAFLGGANFDGTIVEHLVDSFQQKTGVDLRENKVVMQRLAFAAESAKISLSRVEETRVRIPCVTQMEGVFVDLDEELTRAMLEEWTRPLIERAMGAVDELLQKAGTTPAQVDEIVLVGGQTRMPAIPRRLAHFKRLSSDKDIHPEFGVAIGAALLGLNLGIGNVALYDVAPMSISLMFPGGVTREVIPANTPLPCSRSVALVDLPPSEAALPVAIFESLDATSIDREIFGTVLVGPEWRTGMSGAPVMHLQLAEDFSLSAKLQSTDGREDSVNILDPKSMSSDTAPIWTVDIDD